MMSQSTSELATVPSRGAKRVLFFSMENVAAANNSVLCGDGGDLRRDWKHLIQWQQDFSSRQCDAQTFDRGNPKRLCAKP